MNWTKLIDDLLGRGQTYVTIGGAIGSTPDAVRKLKLNPAQNPRWHTGNALIKLHSKVMRKRSNAALTGGEAVPVESTVMQRKD